MLKALRGQIPMLLRHPSGAAVVAAAFTAASSAQRNAMAVEFYGRELSLFAVRALALLLLRATRVKYCDLAHGTALPSSTAVSSSSTWTCLPRAQISSAASL